MPRLAETSGQRNFAEDGISRKAARVIVFTTSKYGGLELDHFAAVQGYGWLQYLLGHLRCQYGTGKSMKMLIEFTQLECGCITPVFKMEYKEHMTTILTHNWVTEIWAYLSLFKGQLDTIRLWTTKKQRGGDQAVMEISVRIGQFLACETKELNRSHTFLQALFVSDIAEVNSKEIPPGKIGQVVQIQEHYLGMASPTNTNEVDSMEENHWDHVA
jgi:hypothetical protein